MNPRVEDVIYIYPYKLLLTFTNGEKKEFDFACYVNYPVYSALADPAFCKQAKVYNGTVVWNNETDFDPDTLYLESVSCMTV